MESALDFYCIDSAKLDQGIGRNDEIQRVIKILSKRSKNNPLLIGEARFCTNAVVEGLQKQILEGDVPRYLIKVSIVKLDMGLLVTGEKYAGSFEARLRELLKEVKLVQEHSEAIHSQIIVFINSIHLVLGTMESAKIFKTMLARGQGQLRCIGSTTLEEYKMYIQKDVEFESLFEKVYVSEPSVANTISILRGLKEKYEKHHGLRIEDSALVLAAQLSSCTRDVTGKFLPEKAINLVDEACAEVRVRLNSKKPAEIVSLSGSKRKRDDLQTTLPEAGNNPDTAAAALNQRTIQNVLIMVILCLERLLIRVESLNIYRKPAYPKS